MARALFSRRVVAPVRSCLFFFVSPDCARRQTRASDSAGAPDVADLPASAESSGLTCLPVLPDAPHLASLAGLVGLAAASGLASPLRPPRAALSG